MSIIKVYHNDNLVTTIHYTVPSAPIQIENYTDDIFSRAFGANEHPTWKDLEDFLESRCIPKTRTNIKEILDYMEISYYDPWQISKKTHGYMAGDKISLEFEDTERDV